MALGLVLYDLLFLLLGTVTYGLAGLVSVRVFEFLGGGPFALIPAAVAALATLVLQVGVLSALCPKLTPGRYPLMSGTMFWAWMVRHLLRRLLMVPGVKWALFTSNVLRFCALRALGAKVAFTVNMSSDVDLLDPSLLEVGAGATLGAKTFISGHYVDRGLLVLGQVTIGERALLAAEVSVSPGVTIGRKAVIKPRAGLGPDVTVGDEAQVGSTSLIDSGVRIGARADLGHRTYVQARAVIADDAQVAANSHVH